MSNTADKPDASAVVCKRSLPDVPPMPMRIYNRCVLLGTNDGAKQTRDAFNNFINNDNESCLDEIVQPTRDAMRECVALREIELSIAGADGLKPVDIVETDGPCRISGTAARADLVAVRVLVAGGAEHRIVCARKYIPLINAVHAIARLGHHRVQLMSLNDDATAGALLRQLVLAQLDTIDRALAELCP